MDLAQAGVHFGHRASRWNPKMKPFIKAKRKLIHIIDLKQTCRALAQASIFLENLCADGGNVLFVGTKRPARAVVEEIAKKYSMPYAVERWLGGSLTNHTTVLSRLTRLEEIEAMERTGEIERYSKKMISAIMREKRKLLHNLSGIRKLSRLPKSLVVIDPGHEKIAVLEARKLNIPVVALIDTDSDPDSVDIPIPGNDDAMCSIQIILRELGEAIDRGVKRYLVSGGPKIEEKPKAAAPQEAVSSERRPHRRGGRGRGPGGPERGGPRGERRGGPGGGPGGGRGGSSGGRGGSSGGRPGGGHGPRPYPPPRGPQPGGRPEPKAAPAAGAPGAQPPSAPVEPKPEAPEKPASAEPSAPPADEKK
jgi:small subunit ribosomal protein S2